MIGLLFAFIFSLSSLAQDEGEATHELQGQRDQQAHEVKIISAPLQKFQQLNGETSVSKSGDEIETNNSVEKATDTLTGLTPESIENGLRERLTHPIAKDFIERHPELLYFVGQWYAGPEQAFIHFLKILEEKEKLKTYAFIVLAVFIIGQILGAFPPKKGLFLRLIYKLFLTILTFSVFFGAFGFIFQTEMAPTCVVAKRVFLKNKSFF